MDYFKRIISVPEKFYLEIFIHSIKVDLPLPGFFQIVVKRNKRKQEKTAIYPYEAVNEPIIVDSFIDFPVTLYRNASGYCEKFYFFRLIQINSQNTIKNGKAKIDISSLLDKPMECSDLSLKNCTDPKGSICVSAVLKKCSASLSFCGGLPDESCDKKADKSFFSLDDYNIRKKEEENKRKVREIFLKKVERRNSLRNSSNSAKNLEESSDNPEVLALNNSNSPEETGEFYTGFTIKLILIESSEEDEKKSRLAPIKEEKAGKKKALKHEHKHSNSESSEQYSEHEELTRKMWNKNGNAKILSGIQNYVSRKPLNISIIKADPSNKNSKPAKVKSPERSTNKCCRCIIL